MVPPNFVLATLAWISFIIVSCRNYYHGQSIRAQLEFNDTASLQTCRFPDVIQCTVTTSGLTPDLPRLLHYKLVKTWNSSDGLSPWLRRRLSSGLENQSGKGGKQNFVHYESVNNDLHINAKCSQKSNHHMSFTFIGIILFNAEAYLIRPQSIIPSSPPRPLDVVIYKIRDDTPLSAEKSINSKIEPPRILGTSLRHRRAVHDPTTFTVELLVVVDYSVFQKEGVNNFTVSMLLYKWQSRSADGSSDADRTARLRSEIKKYYSHVVDGVDSRYRNIAFTDFTIRVQLMDVVIMEQNLFSPSSNGNNKINADTALKDFRKWTNETRNLPIYDHAVLFVGYDLYTNTSKDNGNVSHTSGLAYIGTMCQPGDSLSVVEEQGGFQSIGTATHELGHSMGALHDGEQNPCRSEDRFIMAASGFGPVPPEKRLNPWQFSSCSVEYFRSFIATHLTDGSLCLVDSEPARSSRMPEVNVTLLEDDSEQLPGQHYSPDEQCRLIWGPASYLCRGSEFGDPSSLCTTMYCRDPATLNDCVLHTAARGTSCGDKQWCIDGKCEYSEMAPTKQADCVLGDQPGTAFNGLACEELVDRRPSYCYQDKVRARCCHSCNHKALHRTDCEFGDRIHGCRPWHCSHAAQTSSILSDCCATCNTGELTPSPPASATHQENHPPEVQMTGCHDNDDVNGLKCKEYVQTYGAYICYHRDSWGKQCCSTCAEIRSHKPDCEYGDKTPMLCAKIANLTELHCATFGHQCCESCSEDEARTSIGASIHCLNILVFCFMMATFLSVRHLAEIIIH